MSGDWQRWGRRQRLGFLGSTETHRRPPRHHNHVIAPRISPPRGPRPLGLSNRLNVLLTRSPEVRDKPLRVCAPNVDLRDPAILHQQAISCAASPSEAKNPQRNKPRGEEWNGLKSLFFYRRATLHPPPAPHTPWHSEGHRGAPARVRACVWMADLRALGPTGGCRTRLDPGASMSGPW